MKKPVIIFGTDQLGRAALDIFQDNGIVVYGFLEEDSEKHGEVINDIPVLASPSEEKYLALLGKDCEAFIAVSSIKKREQLLATLKESNKIVPINAIHPSAIISKAATFGYGNLINAHAVLAANATVHNNCIIQANAVIDQHATLQDNVQVGAGSIIGEGVTLHEAVFVGAGATIVSGVDIGKGASIGVGAVVLANVKAGDTVLGNPATAVKIK